MIISSQGFGHFTQGLNNQDFGMEVSQMLLVLDGCSGAKFSEVGTRLFGQLFFRREGFDQHEKFEENVREIFEELIAGMRKYYASQQELEEEFIQENLLFTILACFELEDKYVVKIFGDGYIITENKQGLISYMRFSYGKYPPYFAYKYCSHMDYQNRSFKTFEFSKEDFVKVGIASDGILPIVKGEIRGIEDSIVQGNDIAVEMAIKTQKQIFFDDVTIGMLLGGELHENVSGK